MSVVARKVIGKGIQEDFLGRNGGRPYFVILVSFVVKYND